ncbi:MAG TPA: hypothetical protein VF324_02895 [Methanobacterium sp.]
MKMDSLTSIVFFAIRSCFQALAIKIIDITEIHGITCFYSKPVQKNIE